MGISWKFIKMLEIWRESIRKCGKREMCKKLKYLGKKVFEDAIKRGKYKFRRGLKIRKKNDEIRGKMV